MSGIIGYGLYIPKYRIETAEIAKMWQKDPMEIFTGLKVRQKSIHGIDEDTVTISIEAGKRAISMAGIKASVLQAVYIGSESHPYAVNPTSTTVAEYLGVGNDYFAADLEFACKAGTAGMQVLVGLLSAGEIDYGLVIGADAAQGKPHDALEYTAASAGAAYILGKKKASPTLEEIFRGQSAFAVTEVEEEKIAAAPLKVAEKGVDSLVLPASKN